MQRWTTKRPDRPGYWWTLNTQTNISSVKQILFHRYLGEELLCCIYQNEYIPLIGNNFKYFLWGSEKLTEPLGEKI